MTSEEFEQQYRDAIDDALNQMQTVVLLLAQAETKTVELGNSLQNIRSMMNAFFAQQSSSDTLDDCPPCNTELELRQILAQRQ